MNTYTDYLGIDVSKLTFDVVNQSQKHKQYENNAKGFLKFKRSIPAQALCVMEFTGIYYLPLAKYLFSKGIATSVVNPLKIKRFSQMKLNRNKTDKADAKMISMYAQEQETLLWKPSSLIVEQSKDLYQVLEQNIEFRASLKNKLDGLKSKSASKDLIELVLSQIESISTYIDGLQEKLDALVTKYDPIMLKNIKSIVGIGQRTAALLIISTEGFKNFDNAKQVSSFFGLAPTETRSGTSINGVRKISKKGSPLVRKKLYMCSLQASRHNRACFNLYQRLLAKGKPKKVALIAVANKLLKISFAISKSGIPFDNEYISYKTPM